MAAGMGRPVVRWSVKRLPTAQHVLLGGSGAILVTACLLPLIWPLIGLVSAGGVGFGMRAGSSSVASASDSVGSS